MNLKQKYFLSCLLGCFLFTNIPVFAELSKDDTLFDDAETLDKSGNTKKALEKIIQFLEENPDSFEAKTNECAYLIKLKRLDDATHCLEITLSKYPNDVDNIINRGTIYALRGDESNSIEQYKKSIELYMHVLDIEHDNKFASKGIEYSNGKLIEILELKTGSIIVAVLVVVLTTIIGYYFRYKKLLEIQKTEQVPKTREKRIKDILFHKIVIIFLTGLISIPILLFIISFRYKVQIIIGSDIANWVATVTEVVVGVTVAAIILSYELSKQTDFEVQQRSISEQTSKIDIQTGNIKDIVTTVNNILKTEKEQRESKKKHEEKEIVHALVFTRSRLQGIIDTVEHMKEDEIFRYSEIEENWKSMGKAPFDKLDDIVKGSGDIIDSEIKSQVSIIKGQLRADLSKIIQPYTAIIQINGILRLINRLLTNQLNSHRLEIIKELKKGMDESMSFGRSQGHQEHELSSVKSFHEAEISKYTIHNDVSKNV